MGVTSLGGNMELTWYGLSCFRLAERGFAQVITDPFDEKVGLKVPNLKADIVTVSHDARGHNHIAGVIGYSHALTGPGEYEIGGVFITGIATAQQSEQQRNVLFMFDYEGLTVAHLGDMSQVPTQTQIEALEQVNVLLVPVGGGGSLNASQAAELVSMLEPNVVVPMHYAMPKLNIELDGVERFLSEMGVAKVEEMPVLRLSRSKLPEETEIAILNPRV
jgi:L-ascorbate metabolism protein UlaG (beta-lactamase superfamily)